MILIIVVRARIHIDHLALHFVENCGEAPVSIICDLDAALAAVRACPNPKDRAAMAKSLSTLKTETAVGLVDFTAGPVPNCAPTGLVGVQWLRGKGGANKFGLEIVSNADHPKVPLTAQMTPYKLG